MKYSPELKEIPGFPGYEIKYDGRVFKYGKEKFIKDAIESGIDGAIIPDLPFDEETDLYELAKKSNFYVIYLVSPSNTLDRAKKIVEKSMGFVYYILLKGVTGARKKNESDLRNLITLRKHTNKPFFAGFGISNTKQAGTIFKYADGVIIGSAFIDEISRYVNTPDLLIKKSEEFVKGYVYEAEKAAKK